MIRPVGIVDLYNVPAELDEEAEFPDLYEFPSKKAWFLHPFSPPSMNLITESRTVSYSFLGWFFSTRGSSPILRRVSTSEADSTFTLSNPPDPNVFGIPDEPVFYRTETQITNSPTADTLRVRYINDQGQIETITDITTPKQYTPPQGQSTSVDVTENYSRSHYFRSVTTNYSEGGSTTNTISITLSDPDSIEDALERSGCPDGVIGTSTESFSSRFGSVNQSITIVGVKFGFKLFDLIPNKNYTLKYSFVGVRSTSEGADFEIIEEPFEYSVVAPERSINSEGGYTFLVDHLFNISPHEEEEEEGCGQGPELGEPQLEIPTPDINDDLLIWVTNFVIYPAWSRIVDVPES